MKQVMMIKFDSLKWRMIDEYKVANPFIEVGFRQVKDVVDLRVFDLLNISRINNNRAEEMLLCIYHLLQPDRRIDEGIYNDEIDQYFSYREWKKKHQPLSGVTVREILTTEDLNEGALLRIFDGVTAAFYKSDEYNSREYRYSNLLELRKAMKHKEGGTNLHCLLFARSDARCVYRQKIFRALPGVIFFYSESDIKAAWLL